MIDKLKTAAEQINCKLEVVSADKIALMRQDIVKLSKEAPYNETLKNRIYNSAQVKKIPSEVQSVVILAVPTVAAYINFIFNRNGKEHKFFGLAGVPFNESVNHIIHFVTDAGYNISTADKLPLKRLAVQSGLAEYGKNNIAYVKGMGSFCALEAFYTNIPCRQDNWREAVASDMCDGCTICLESCATGAIAADRFIIDRDICMRKINSRDEDFPDWLPVTAHHTLYGCLKCQGKCPINISQRPDSIDVVFDEEETELLRNGASLKNASDEFKQKFEMFGKMNKVKKRNMRNLFELMDEGYEPCL